MPSTPAARRWRSVATFLLVLLAAVLLVSFLLIRAHRTDLTASRLCQVISQIVQQGDDSLNGVYYYRRHPQELAQAHARNRHVLERLDCSVSPPVKGKKK